MKKMEGAHIHMNEDKEATTYWITGYSGVGKTTVGRELYKILKQKNAACVFLDGDKFREVFGNDWGYTKEDRYRGAMSLVRLCELLTSQDIDVVCCTVSMFNEVREWGRKHIKNYIEVYLKVSANLLQKRNQKDLYSGHAQGSVSNVVGLDLQLDEPRNTDIVIENDGSISAIAAAQMILKRESYYAKR